MKYIISMFCSAFVFLGVDSMTGPDDIRGGRSIVPAGQYDPDKPLLFSRDTRTPKAPLVTEPATLGEALDIARRTRMARIASFDGGGIRGIIPAQWCTTLEGRTGSSMSDLFHMFAGTSTGGIIAAGLSVRDEDNRPLYSASDILNMYMGESSHKIFNRRGIFNNCFGLIKSRYKTSPAYGVYTEYFQSKKLSELSNDVLIPYYDMTNCRPRFFKSYKARDGRFQTNSDYFLRDAIASTTAAPTFFKLYKLRTAYRVDKGINSYIRAADGGLFANNPVLCALSDAQDLYPLAESYFVLSMSTGIFREAVHPRSLISWARALPDILMRNAADMTQFIMQQVSKILGSKLLYYRLEIDLPKMHSSMDNLDSENLSFLLQSADDDGCVSEKMNNVVRILETAKTPREEMVRQRNVEQGF